MLKLTLFGGPVTLGVGIGTGSGAEAGVVSKKEKSADAHGSDVGAAKSGCTRAEILTLSIGAEFRPVSDVIGRFLVAETSGVGLNISSKLAVDR